jgi:hypothetical protein
MQGTSRWTLPAMRHAACRGTFARTQPFTHVLYAALYEENALVASWRSRAQQDINLTLLRNVLGGVEAGGRLQHFTILQGGNAYGSHLGRVSVPAKERWPRMPHEIFYFQPKTMDEIVGASWQMADLTFLGAKTPCQA